MTTPGEGRPSSMRIRISPERRERVLHLFKEFHADAFDEIPSDFRCGRILDFFVENLGPTLYNQAIQDARGFLIQRLDDLEGEFYESENPESK